MIVAELIDKLQKYPRDMEVKLVDKEKVLIALDIEKVEEGGFYHTVTKEQKQIVKLMSE